MKRHARLRRAWLPALPGLALAVLVTVSSAGRAPGCEIEMLQIVEGLDDHGTLTTGKPVTYQVRFKNTPDSAGSVRILYGDGSAEDSGLRAFNSPFRFTHVYSRPGTFRASVNGGKVRPCTNRFEWGSGGMEVQVVESSSHAKTRSAGKDATLGTEPTGVLLAPKSSAQKAQSSKDPLAAALAAGQISGASVTPSIPGHLLKIEGSGRCALRVVEDLDGKTLSTTTYKGTLPTTMQLLNVLPGLHGLRIEGDTSNERCAGTATTSFPVGKRTSTF